VTSEHECTGRAAETRLDRSTLRRADLAHAARSRRCPRRCRPGVASGDERDINRRCPRRRGCTPPRVQRPWARGAPGKRRRVEAGNPTGFSEWRRTFSEARRANS